MKTGMKGWLKVTAIAAGVVVLGTGAILGGQAIRSATVQPEPTSVVKIADDPTSTPTVTPSPTPAPTVAPVVETPPVQEIDTPDPTVINDDGSVSGPGCPPPYVDLGYGCQDPICGVDENGNNIPCGG